MARSGNKIKKLRCRWCGHWKRWRYPERADCEQCNRKHAKGKSARAPKEAL